MVPIESMAPEDLLAEREGGFLLPLDDLGDLDSKRPATARRAGDSQSCFAARRGVPSPHTAAHRLHRSGSAPLLKNLLGLRKPPGSSAALARGLELLELRRCPPIPASAFSVDEGTSAVLATYAPTSLQLIEAVTRIERQSAKQPRDLSRRGPRGSLNDMREDGVATSLWETAGYWHRVELFRLQRLQEQGDVARKRHISAAGGLSSSHGGGSRHRTIRVPRTSASPRRIAHRSQILGTAKWWEAVKGSEHVVMSGAGI